MGFGSSLKKALKKSTKGIEKVAKKGLLAGDPYSALAGYAFDKSKGGGGGGSSGGDAPVAPQFTPQQIQSMQWSNDMNGIFAKLAPTYGVNPSMYLNQMQQIPQQQNPLLAQQFSAPQQQMNPLLQQLPQQPQVRPQTPNNPLLQRQQFNRYRTPVFRFGGF